jgi:hypothetical protein
LKVPERGIEKSRPTAIEKEEPVEPRSIEKRIEAPQKI